MLLPVLSDLTKLLLPPTQHVLTLDHHRVLFGFLGDEADIVQEAADGPRWKAGQMVTPPKFFCNILCSGRVVVQEEIVRNVSQRIQSEAVLHRSGALAGFTTAPFPRRHCQLPAQRLRFVSDVRNLPEINTDVHTCDTASFCRANVRVQLSQLH